MHLDEMLTYNRNFVEQREYEPFQTDNIPNKRTVIFTCMDTRLVDLLPRALNIQNGDVKMVKNAGAILRKSFDSIMKSILVAIYELKAEQVMVIGHHDCGMSHIDTDAFKKRMMEKGLSEETLQTIEHAGIDLDSEFGGFDTIEKSVEESVSVIRNHPLLPAYVSVHGLTIDPQTGKVELVTRGE